MTALHILAWVVVIAIIMFFAVTGLTLWLLEKNSEDGEIND